MAVDLKNPAGVELVLRLVEQAEGLMEGFRPGVAEEFWESAPQPASREIRNWCSAG